jgi:hypothetical protein
MLRFLMVPAACLALSGAAAAQDMPELATLSPPDQAAGAAAGSLPAPGLRRTGQASVASLTLRGADAGPAPAVDAKNPPGPAKPWCAEARRIGTGAGFCMIN